METKMVFFRDSSEAAETHKDPMGAGFSFTHCEPRALPGGHSIGTQFGGDLQTIWTLWSKFEGFALHCSVWGGHSNQLGTPDHSYNDPC